MLCSMIRSFLFMPPTPSYIEGASGLRFATRDELSTSQLTLVSVPYFYEMIDETWPTILFSHGNAEDAGQCATMLNHLGNQLRANICVYDYVGYGLNPGTCSEANCYLDIDTVYTALITTHQVAPENLIILGRSMGSGPACYLAEQLCRSEVEFKGLVLISPLSSTVKTVLPFSVWGDPFPNYHRAPRITCRTILFHGTVDTVVPPKASIELDRHLAGPHELHLMLGYGHNGLETSVTVLSEIRRFFNLDCPSSLPFLSPSLPLPFSLSPSLPLFPSLSPPF